MNLHPEIQAYSLGDVERILNAHEPNTEPTTQVEKHAAVAMLLRDGPSGLEALFIQRAEHPEDPWSGHMALPGGRKELTDPTLDAAARRETEEEVGIPVPVDNVIARLDDVYGGRLVNYGLAVAPFVCRCDFDGELQLNYEVADAVWVPIAYLADTRNIVNYQFRIESDARSFPSFQFAGYIIWGMTYYIITNFMGRFDIELPLDALPSPSDFE